MWTVRVIANGDVINRVLTTELSTFDHSTPQKFVFKVTVIILKVYSKYIYSIPTISNLTFSNLHEGNSGKERNLFFLR